MDEKVDIQNCVQALAEDGIILYPTDTIWGLGCDATSAAAIKKIFLLKKREENKSMIILISSWQMLCDYVVEPPDEVMDYYQMENAPTTFIFERAKNLPSILIGADQTIAIRIPKDQFCIDLINALGKPLVSTSANISHENFPKNFHEIVPEIKNGVDYIVQHRQDDLSKSAPSTIYKIKQEGPWEKIR